MSDPFDGMKRGDGVVIVSLPRDGMAAVYTPDVIASIGPKWATTCGGRRFRRPSRRDVVCCSWLYRSVQEYRDEMETETIVSSMRRAMAYGAESRYTLDQLRQIAAILGIEVKE